MFLAYISYYKKVCSYYILYLMKKHLFTSERIIFCELRTEDYIDILNLRKNTHVRKYLWWPVDEWSFDLQFREMLDTQELEIYFILRNKQDQKFIWILCVTKYHWSEDYELSYEINPDFWWKGYASEWCKKVLEYAFWSLWLAEIYAETQEKNIASIRLLEKLGFTKKDRLIRFDEWQGVYFLEK